MSGINGISASHTALGQYLAGLSGFGTNSNTLPGAKSAGGTSGASSGSAQRAPA